ncbi:MAG: hypothetical protein F4Y92_05950 [Dehalococcoidia bacterium]|nr:hypothetical protein [Dehalococcoidia bacterium]
MWAALQAEYGDQIEFVSVDANTRAGADFSDMYGIRGHPGFVAIDANGDVIHAALGPFDEEELRELVASLVPE